MEIKPVYMLDEIRNHLIKIDPFLERLFSEVDISMPNGKLDFQYFYKKPYIALIGAILGQRISYKQAKDERSKLYSILGIDFKIQDINNYLNQSHTNHYNQNIMRNLQKYLFDNNINDDIINSNDFNLDSLLSIEGIGPWTINTCKLVCFKSWDLYPEGDLFIKKKIKKLYQMDKDPTIKQIREISNKWSPYRTIVTWYFWRWFT
jgi:3-methyladenine DNA glycosylase/8-oxoguanine DNA glycosylase